MAAKVSLRVQRKLSLRLYQAAMRRSSTIFRKLQNQLRLIIFFQRQ